ncbi:MAG: CPBP family intramembrane glutamic endopeptidase [Thermoplasmata archaeon]
MPAPHSASETPDTTSSPSPALPPLGPPTAPPTPSLAPAPMAPASPPSTPIHLCPPPPYASQSLQYYYSPPMHPVYTPVRPWSPYARHRVLAVFVAAIALANFALTPILLVALADVPLDDPEGVMRAVLTPQILLLTTLVQDVLLVGLTYVAVFRPRHLTLQEIGLTREGLGALPIAVGVLSGLGMLGASLVMGYAMERLAGIALEETLFRVPSDAGGLALLLIAVAAVAPPAEEFFFRGYALPAIQKRAGPAQGLLLSSLMFAAAHLSLPSLLPLFVAGLWLGLLFRRYGIVPSIIAHAVNNVAAVALLGLGV